MPGRRSLLLGLGAALAAPPRLGVAGSAGRVTLMSGATEGGAADNWVRAFAPFLERHLPRRSVEVVSRSGLGGLSMLNALVDAAPDGRMLGHVLTPELLARAVEQGAPDMPLRLRFLGSVAEEPVVLVASPGVDLAELRALGDGGVLGLPPAGTGAALAASGLVGLLSLSPLNFPSGAAARQAALSGNVAAALVRLPDTIAALRDGRLSAVGVASDRRCELLGDVPTLAEQGVPVRAASRRGFVLPLGVPDELARPLAAALRDAVSDPEYAAQAQALGSLPRYLDEAAWTDLVRRDLAALTKRWATAPWVAPAG
ncbi:tripartite tricarboxylate transporter substrate-binding protein [Roseomonas sp. BN140053]|uniref:tripartite tricarboxylate transporter substrate-binding protein n=1 Tax=Roseomonas sp. BN140053 TaxID=3391898 RepID=UPI0039EC68E1